MAENSILIYPPGMEVVIKAINICGYIEEVVITHNNSVTYRISYFLENTKEGVYCKEFELVPKKDIKKQSIGFK